MKRLNPTTQNYAWGSRSLLAALRNEDPTADPEAELWYGAHPDAPSTLGGGSSLLDQITADPVARLGQSVVDRFGRHLPFLLKLLAADSPLSIQAHPTMEQAVEGFAREDAHGIDRTARHRCFRDPFHKPELIVAVTEFEAMIGFRPIEPTLDFLTQLGANELASVLANHGPRNAVAWLLSPRDRDAAIASANIERITDAAAELSNSAFTAEADLITRLAASYPGDPGIGVAALLNRVLLEPGEGLYLDAGTLHAYVGGLGIELMANSNNVLRGGLTPKHIDVHTLLEVLKPDVRVPTVLHRRADNTYDVPAEEFFLRLIQSGFEVTGPAIALSVTGEVTAKSENSSLVLLPTEALWIDAGETVFVESSGTGAVATANLSTNDG